MEVWQARKEGERIGFCGYPAWGIGIHHVGGDFKSYILGFRV